MVNGSQMKVVCHVDDLKVSHKSEFYITRFTDYLISIYVGLSSSQGKVHDYLGMNLDFSDKGKLQVSMIPYLINVLKELSEELGAAASSTEPDHLFKIRTENEATYLPEDQAQNFHRTVAQLLFLSARARRDTQTSVAFLTKRVKKKDEEDWFKMRRLLKYLRGDISLKLTLTADDLSIINWYVDASDAIHDDCKGHTGAMMSMGGGAVTSF